MDYDGGAIIEDLFELVIDDFIAETKSGLFVLDNNFGGSFVFDYFESLGFNFYFWPLEMDIIFYLGD